MPDRISESALGRLKDSAYSALRDIDCVHQDGVLILRGCLPSHYLKQMAQASVADVPGVRAVTNRIKVTTPAPRRAVGL